MIYQTNSKDQTTKITIQVKAPNGTTYEVDKITSFSLAFDILNLGDPFSITVPDPKKKWKNILVPGQPLKVFASNPNVQNGAQVQMYDGLIVNRQRISDIDRGSVIQLNCFDKGWYLLNNCPEVWQQITTGTYVDLFKKYAGDSTWGFVNADGTLNLTTDAATSRKIRQGLVKGRQGELQAAAVGGLLVYRIQTEPGMTNASLLLKYAKNFGRLCNITPDGAFQVFTPDYAQNPSYRLDYHDDNQRVKNNVLNIRIQEKIDSVYTNVTVVGETVLNLTPNPDDPNTGKFRGYASNSRILPFTHNLSYTEGELYESGYANVAAKWRLDRGLFDASTYIYRVRGHQQQGKFWTPDTMVQVNDTVNDVVQNLYLAFVRLERTPQGDIAELHLKYPNLLVPVQIVPNTPTIAR